MLENIFWKVNNIAPQTLQNQPGKAIPLSVWKCAYVVEKMPISPICLNKVADTPIFALPYFSGHLLPYFGFSEQWCP